MSEKINMKNCPVLLLLLLVLWDGRPDLTGAEPRVFTATEGEDFRAICLFYLLGNKKIFCKNDCNKKEDILVETTGDSLNNDRYSIEHDKSSPGLYVMYVSIKDVSRSDSGRYQCGLDYGQKNANIVEFNLEVRSGPTSSSPAVTSRTAVTGLFYNVTTTQQTEPSSEVSNPTESQEHHRKTTLSGTQLYVGLAAIVVIIILTIALIICLKMSVKKKEEHLASSDYCQIPEANSLYEEIPDVNRAAPVSSRNTTEHTTYSVASAPSEEADRVYEEIPGENRHNTASFRNTSDIYSLALAPSEEPNRLYEEVPGENRAGVVKMCTASVSAYFRENDIYSETTAARTAPD